MATDSGQFDLLNLSLRRDVTSNNTRVLWLRWVTGVVVLVATFGGVHALGLTLPELPLYALGVFILAYNGLLTWWTQRATSLDDGPYSQYIRKLFVLQIALDWMSLMVFMHLTGGITSPALSVFYLHVILVVVLLPGQSPYIYCIIAVIMIGVVQGAEVVGFLPHYVVIPGFPPDLHLNVYYALALAAFFAVTIVAVAYLTSTQVNRLRARDRQLAVLFESTRDLTSTLELDTVLARLARSVTEAMAVRAASIRLLDEQTQTLSLAASVGLSEQYLSKGPVQVPYSELDREALTGSPVIIHNPAYDPRLQYPEEIAREGIQSMLVVPIVGQGRSLGVLRVYCTYAHRFTASEAEFVMAIARQGATAIENALAHDALQQSDQERAQFVRIVTHELRAPVTGAQSLVMLLKRGMVGSLTAEQMEIVSRLDRRLASLLALISDLLSFAAGKAVDVNQPLEPIAVAEPIRQLVEERQADAEAKSISLSFRSVEESLTVRAHEEGIMRIFDNLIGNAIKYTPHGGVVLVYAERHDNEKEAVITVADTGIGIPQESLDRLGEEFFRAQNAKEAGIIGTGLGMAIVKELLTRFGGTLHVESEEGVGSTFMVSLPLVEDGCEKKPDN